MLSAYNGPRALEIAEADQPDIILLDVMMPRMDGFEVCCRLKANPHTADIPVVMVTALGQIADRVHLAEKTVKNYVSNMLAKLGMARRSEAAAYAARLAESRRTGGPG